ncbi:hypothetical protein PPERSA_00111 [Pseudocohnilembus persalinus]|uniref:Short-chain dehydrogenase/reductase SDR n=1 Tax=Pseudocohnilembus persalinus TaxID=266149 RepID=A0A0V0Q8E4_PSEPJ|nr:hypothetical protein PPERSA_00111 [Pseudocohnilembus persalinus]|eukprot:KRW98514.1 hypothetical protein PPERSA_00111 [Pseudocohnilembus persalinus]
MQNSKLYQTLDISKYTVLVTGATAGIGRAIALRFAELGCQLVLIGRREERLQELSQEIAKLFPETPQPENIKLDLSDVEAIKKLPEQLKNKNIDILVNNAGLALGVTGIDNNNIEDSIKVVQTNLIAVITLCSLFIPGMKERKRGHVINISSVAGQEAYEGGSVYCASKFAINGFSMAGRFDLAGTPVKVTTISPGLVETEFSQVRFKGDQEKAAKVYSDIAAMQAEDIADQTIYAATRPARVQIADIKAYCTNQPHAKYGIVRCGPEMQQQQ